MRKQIITTSIDKEARQANYDVYYLSVGIDKEKLIEKYKIEKDGISGWQCVCNYCLNRSTCFIPGIMRECCITGSPCAKYIPNQKKIDEDKNLG